MSRHVGRVLGPALTVALALGLVSATGRSAPKELEIRFPAPHSGADSRHQYSLALLEAILSRTAGAYGPAKIVRVLEVMNEERQVSLLAAGSAELDLITRPPSKELEKKLTPVRIPLDKGLLGYRLFLIRKADQPKFAAVRDLAQLKKLVAGQGRDWNDVDVYEKAGLRLETGASYEGLFEMLQRGRFDYFPRGVLEIFRELNTRREKFPDLAIEETLALNYPYASYFWTANNAVGRRLAERLRDGLEGMIKDGTLDKLFFERHGEAIEQAAIAKRRVLRIPNPNLPDATPLDRRELWYDPTAAPSGMSRPKP